MAFVMVISVSSARHPAHLDVVHERADKENSTAARQPDIFGCERVCEALHLEAVTLIANANHHTALHRIVNDCVLNVHAFLFVAFISVLDSVHDRLADGDPRPCTPSSSSPAI